MKRALFFVSTPTLLGTVSLAAIGAAAYWPFYAPVLYADDWTEIVGWSAKGMLRWITLARLPLHITPRWLQYTLFGLNVDAYYVVLWSTVVLGALLLFSLLKRILPGRPQVAFAGAVLSLVYPADLTHMWLTTIHIRVALCLALAYALLLWRYYQSGGVRWMLGALACLAVSLLSYEGPLGIALVFAILVSITKDIPRKRRVRGIAWPFVLGLAYTVWRNLVLPRAVDVFYTIDSSMPPDYFFRRLAVGLKVLIYAWTMPLGRLLGLTSTGTLLVGLALTVCLCWFCAAVWLRLRRSEPAASIQERDTSPELSGALPLLGAGLALALAGYIPPTLALTTNLESGGSRVTIFAGLGASLAVAAALWAGGELLSRRRDQVRYFVLAGLAPLLIFAAGVQASVQYANRATWEDLKLILGGLLSACPRPENGTVAWVVLTGYGDQYTWGGEWQRTPFAGGWELTPIISTLYGDETLGGFVSYPDIDGLGGMTPPPGAFRAFPGGNPVPRSGTVAIAFDHVEKWLSQAQMETRFPEAAPQSVYVSDRCRPAAPADDPQAKWRALLAR